MVVSVSVVAVIFVTSVDADSVEVLIVASDVDDDPITTTYKFWKEKNKYINK